MTEQDAVTKPKRARRSVNTPQWPAFRALWRDLGFVRALGVSMRLLSGQRRGEPFGDLGPATDERERLSREQIGPAIILYRLLCDRYPKARAYEVTEAVARASGAVFLRRSLGKLTQATLRSLDDEGRQAFLEDKRERFFNAEIQWGEVSDERVRFTVSACHFPRLCLQAGVPELAPVFCAVDEGYFGSIEPNVVLERPHTIAGGAETCSFHLYWQSSKDD